MKKKIIFIPDQYYLSNPIFLEFTKKIFSGWELVYLNSGFPISRIDKKDYYNTQEIKSAFCSYEEINNSFFDFFITFFNKGKIVKFFSLIQFINRFSEFKKELYKKLNHLEPDAIIITADKTTVSKLVSDWSLDKKTEIVLLQSAFFAKEEIPFFKNLKRKASFYFMNRLLSLPYSSKQFEYGKENPSNFIFLWGDYFNRYFKKETYKTRIRIVGNPLYDSIIESSKQNKKINALSKKKPIVSIFTTPYLDVLNKEQEKVVAEIYQKLINNNSQWFFVLKIHPRQEPNFYEELLKDNQHSNFHITKSTDINEVLGSSNVQISMFSYTSFQAIVAGVPIILFKDEYITTHDYFNNEIELRANTLVKLEESITKTMTTEYLKEYTVKRNKFLDSRLFALDGKSSERVLNEIRQIINSK